MSGQDVDMMKGEDSDDDEGDLDLSTPLTLFTRHVHDAVRSDKTNLDEVKEIVFGGNHNAEGGGGGVKGTGSISGTGSGTGSRGSSTVSTSVRGHDPSDIIGCQVVMSDNF